MDKAIEHSEPRGRAGKARRASAWAIIAVGTMLLVVLLTYGGPIVPHIAGPVALFAIGAALLASGRKGRAR
jgi:hypothetical protein